MSWWFSPLRVWANRERAERDRRLAWDADTTEIPLLEYQEPTMRIAPRPSADSGRVPNPLPRLEDFGPGKPLPPTSPSPGEIADVRRTERGGWRWNEL